MFDAWGGSWGTPSTWGVSWITGVVVAAVRRVADARILRVGRLLIR